jgi:hypothetical protein
MQHSSVPFKAPCFLRVRKTGRISLPQSNKKLVSSLLSGKQGGRVYLKVEESYPPCFPETWRMCLAQSKRIVSSMCSGEQGENTYLKVKESHPPCFPENREDAFPPKCESYPHYGCLLMCALLGVRPLALITVDFRGWSW